VTNFSGSNKRVAIKFMIFQQHPKQEIARIVPLIGDCRAGAGASRFPGKTFSYQVADHIDRIALFNFPWKGQTE
jgi:hypothetical protein